jgi:hypothetical protein
VIAMAPLHSVHGTPERDQLIRVFRGLQAGVAVLTRRYKAAQAACCADDAMVPVHPAPALHTLIHPDILAMVAKAGDTIVLRETAQNDVFYGAVLSSAAADEGAHAADDAMAGAASAAASASSSSASSATGAAGKQVVVKFCRRYAVGIHERVAGAGFAPKVYNTAEVGGWTVVVMELVTSPWQRLSKVTGPTRELEISVLQAYRQAFLAGTSVPLVHGDARAPNIFVGPAQKKATAAAATLTATATSDAAVAADAGAGADEPAYGVMFIDFEFAGEAGNVRYPLDVKATSFQPVIDLIRRKDPTFQSLGGQLIQPEYDEALIKAAMAGECAPMARIAFDGLSRVRLHCVHLDLCATRLPAEIRSSAPPAAKRKRIA